MKYHPSNLFIRARDSNRTDSNFGSPHFLCMWSSSRRCHFEFWLKPEKKCFALKIFTAPLYYLTDKLICKRLRVEKDSW